MAVLNLVAFAVATIALGSKDGVHTTHHRAPLLNWSVLGAYVRSTSLRQFLKILTVLQLYASVLALVAVSTPPKIANAANTHLVWVLFGTWVVYGYRDIYPLGTFTLQPLDLHEG